LVLTVVGEQGIERMNCKGEEVKEEAPGIPEETVYIGDEG